MKDLLVPAKQAVQLKELGFNEPCLFGYNQDDENKLLTAPQLSSYEINSGKNSDVTKINKVTAPFKAQVFKWFREKHQLNGELYSQLRPSNKFMYGFKIGGSDIIYDGFHTYEEAEDACLDKLIEILKQK
jgi:hypothetical protein